MLYGDLGDKDVHGPLSLLERAVAGSGGGSRWPGRVQGMIGDILSGSHGFVEADHVRARDAYAASASQGSPLGAFNLGLILWKGALGVPRDPALAAAAYCRGAELGHVESRTNLGILHIQGGFEGADFSIGLGLLEEAAGQGDGDAEALLDSLCGHTAASYRLLDLLRR